METDYDMMVSEVADLEYPRILNEIRNGHALHVVDLMLFRIANRHRMVNGWKGKRLRKSTKRG